MAPTKMTMGKGAVVSVLSSRLHPSQHVRTMWLNPEKNHRVENLVVLRQELKKINRRDQMTFVMKHEAFKVDGEYIELYASKRFCIIKSEGDPDFFFTLAPVGENFEAVEQAFVPGEISDIIQRGVLEPNDIEMARNFVEIDDDNDPAPENLPLAGEEAQASIFGEWGHPGTCYRRMGIARNQSPNLSFPPGVRPTIMQLFELLFPKSILFQSFYLRSISR